MALTRKLDFVIAGAQKGGTTALHYFLEQHPAIAFPRKQELHFFDDEERFARKVHEQELHQLFPEQANQARAVGECTPVYLYWRPALPRLRAYNPQIKLVLTLRNPGERAFSHWNMQRERGLEPLDFLDAIGAEQQRAQEAAPLQSRRYSYVDRGRYVQQLRRAFELFPRAQCYVIKFDQLRAEPEHVVGEVCRFLGLEPLRRLKVKEKNTIPYARKMTSLERAKMSEIFDGDISELEQLLGWNCSDWRA